MSNKIALFLLCMLFLVSCAQKEVVEDSDPAVQESNAEIQEPSAPLQENQKNLSRNSTAPPLGNLCSDEQECLSFCQNNKGRCENYCNEHSEDYVCVLLFPSKSLPSCDGEKELFTVSPILFEDLESVVPLGSLNPPDHVFPTDHIYMNVKSDDEILNIPKRAAVAAPGDIQVAQITSSEDPFANPPFTDYDLEFYPCKEVYAKFGHITSLSQKLQNYFDQAPGDCTVHSKDGKEFTRCQKAVSIPLKAGEKIGTTGGFQGAARGLDFWLADNRNEKINYANPSRWGKRDFYITCPADYFTPKVRNTLYSWFKLGKIPRTIEPICGTIEQDVAGTAQGAWLVVGTSDTYSEDLHLALAHDNFNPLKGVFSVDASMSESGLPAGAYLFDPKSSGMVNRDFQEVTSDGNMYCYESLNKKFEDKLPMIIILQMTDSTTLRIEKQSRSECGNGPWSFSSGSTEFER